MTKTTLHYQRIPSWASRAQQALAARWVKLVNPPLGPDPFPDLSKCIRIWTDPWDRPLIAAGSSGATAYWARIVDTWCAYQALDWGHCIFELPNEPECNTTEGLAALDAFTRRCIELADDRFTLVVLNLPEGNPHDNGTGDLDVSRQKVTQLSPCVTLATQRGHFVGLHGYWRPGIEGPTGQWHAMRFKLMVNWWADAGVDINQLHLALTEWGVDGGIAGGPAQKGWRSLMSPAQYIADVAKGEAELRAIPYVQFAALFTAGPEHPWWDFEQDEDTVMKIADRFTYLPHVTSPSQPALPITDIIATLPQHTTKRWPLRTAPPDCIVLHHSVTPPDFPLERIAAYHVSRGYPGIAYHYVISGDGRVYQTNLDTSFTWHGHDGNTGLGVCLLGDFTTQQPPPAQLDAARRLITHLRSKHGPHLPILGHKECGRAQTQCPGRTWDQWKPILQSTAPSPTTSPLSPIRWHAEEAVREIERGDPSAARLRLLHSVIQPLYQLEGVDS